MTHALRMVVFGEEVKGLVTMNVCQEGSVEQLALVSDSGGDLSVPQLRTKFTDTTDNKICNRVIQILAR